jgi:hypothetical protein
MNVLWAEIVENQNRKLLISPNYSQNDIYFVGERRGYLCTCKVCIAGAKIK